MEFPNNAEPVFEALYGFNRRKYIGGRMVGIDETSVRDTEVRHVVTDIAFQYIHSTWELKISVTGENGPHSISGNVDFARVEESGNKMKLSFPYIGEFTIFPSDNDISAGAERRGIRENRGKKKYPLH